VPGTAGLEHRIGGIEKADVTGNISYDPDNHDRMVRLRQAKVDGIAKSPMLEVDDPTATPACSCSAGDRPTARSRPPARSSAGARAPRSRRRTCATSTRSRATSARCCARYDKVIVPEMNLGQLTMLLRAKYLVDITLVNQVRGLPFKSGEPNSPTASPPPSPTLSRACEDIMTVDAARP
jgi:2-oxoglutarate ferredoxin oxidoreductase subunit alpha